MNRKLISRAVVAVLVCGFAFTVAAQRRASGRTVQLAIPDRFPSREATALVVRFAAPGTADLVMLDGRSANPETLGAALAVLRRLRTSNPSPSHDVVTTVTGFATVRQSPARRAQLEETLRTLNARPSARIGNVGPGRWIELPEGTLGR